MPGRPRRGWSPEPTERVRFPIMFQSWNRIAFLHWRYGPEDVQRLLPSQLEVETFDGSAWIGLTPFLLENLRLPGVPPLPFHSSYPETNLRTYVSGPGGVSGIWFFALDSGRLLPALVGRFPYLLPYMWSDLRVEARGTRIHYQGRRRSLGRGARYDVWVEIGEPLATERLSDLDHFLTARWVLFTSLRGRILSSQAEHPRWPLVEARATRVRQDLTEAAGLPSPRGQPLVHFSPGVDARIGPPRWGVGLRGPGSVNRVA